VLATIGLRNVDLFDENIKINIQCAIVLLFLLWVWNLVSYI